jgi:hypothetical protein
MQEYAWHPSLYQPDKYTMAENSFEADYWTKCQGTDMLAKTSGYM